MDIFGQALLDYTQGTLDSKLWLHNNYGSPEEMPVDIFFRSEPEMPELELMAISLCKGKVLDIGAGVGSHALILQDKGFDITALEISASACQIMEARGVRKVINADIMQFSGAKFDTLLLLMNGIGLTGDLAGLSNFLNHAKTLLNPGGALI
ncbi:MAG TPA: class I SAM-dependent methyltransferase, partial [Daejeonella sp.]|nr:class I SAM-dependent methyltransferase [Daejeonella sp.]